MSILSDASGTVDGLAQGAASSSWARKDSTAAHGGVSVLLPAYNVERFVDAALASVQAQTFSDWEVIAVDDQSTDGTYERLLAWSHRDPRIHVYCNELNQGMTGNWNCCLAYASREFVLKLDADDVLRPRTLEVLTTALDRPEIVGAGVRTLCCSVDLEHLDGLPADDAMMNAGIDPYQDQLLMSERWSAIAYLGHQLWHSCAVMTRRQTLNDGGGYDVRFGCAADTELIGRLLAQGGQFAHRAYVGVLYRQVQGSVSHCYRAHDWLRWEAAAANLLNMHRSRARGWALPRNLRRRYAEWWCGWQNVQTSVHGTASVPESIRVKLTKVMDEAGPPPLADRLRYRLRKVAARLAI